ncbi:MAG: hypothetical protein JO061_01505 [Acidobacteriaceae bacterium]|nr:hypothetical protein [Acidobacteriaceae bacterium]
MSNVSQKRAVRNYRKRLRARGICRFEVLGSGTDRELIRSLASRLASDSKDAARIRATVRDAISGDHGPKGGILKALRRSPLVGVDLDVTRPPIEGREIAL